MARKVIYLDIDGVLNSSIDHMKLSECYDKNLPKPKNLRFFNRGDYIDTGKLQLLHSFIEEFDAHVVIVSSWDTFEGDAQAICLFLDVPFHSKALYTGGGTARGEKITKHSKMYGIKKEDYIIIDDSHEYNDKTRLINVNGREGLTQKNIDLARLLLQ